MTPYYNHEGITIYHGDCREVLPSLGRFDLLLTDPPYGLGMAANPVRQRHERSAWDDSPVDASLLNDAMSHATSAIIWGGNYFDLPVHQCFLIWDKVQPEDFSLAMVEAAWTNIKKPAKLFRRHVVSYYKQHPTQKPLELMRWCLSHAPDAKSVLDPFMGSGTTLEAAKSVGIEAVGIEIEEKYCEIAAKRLSQEVLCFE